MKTRLSPQIFITLLLLYTSAYAQTQSGANLATNRSDSTVTNLRANALRDDAVKKVDKAEARSVSVSKTQLLKNLSKERLSIRNSKIPNQKSYLEKNRKDNGAWGGGTSVIRSNRKPIFYDIYMSDPDFEDSYQITANLPVTPFLKKVGYEYIDIKQMAEYPAVLQLLEKWRPKAFGLVTMLEESLTNFKLSYTSMPLQRIDGLALVEPLRDGDSLEPVIIFNSQIGARIGFQPWSKLGDRSRIAAIIHESLRNYQISLGFHHGEKDFDLKLQRICNLLVMQDPQNIAEYLDYTQFFESEVLDYLVQLEDSNLGILEYVRIYNPEFLTDPVKVNNIKKSINDPVFLANWKKRNEEDRVSAFKTDASITNLLSPEPEIALFKKLEQIVRTAIVQRFDPKAVGDFTFDAQVKGLRLINDYLQTRWLDESWYGIWTDTVNLMVWDIQHPEDDIFRNLKKFQKRLLTNFTMPLDKIQSRDVTKIENEKDKHDDVHSQWVDSELEKFFSKAK